MKNKNNTVLDIIVAYNILNSLKDVFIKNAKFSYILSNLRITLKPFYDVYQEELKKLYSQYGKEVEQNKWKILPDNMIILNKEIKGLNEVSHKIDRIEGITKDMIFEIEDLAIPSTFWDLVYDKFFNES